jgi:hypothetical protein
MKRKGITKETHHTRSFPLTPFTTGGAGGTAVDCPVGDAFGIEVLVSVNCSEVPTAVGTAALEVDANAEEVEEPGFELLIEELAESDSDATDDDTLELVGRELVRIVVIVAIVVVVAAIVVVIPNEVSNVKIGTMTELGT